MAFFWGNTSVNNNALIKRLVGAACLAFAGLVFLTPVTASALDLRQAVQQALQNNRLLLAQDARLDEAEAATAQATGHLMPRLTASSGVSRSNSPMTNFAGKLLQERVTTPDFAPAVLNNPSYLTNYRNALTLEAPLYQGGRAWAARDRAEQSEEATRNQIAMARQQLEFAVIRAYTDVLRLESRERAARSALDAANSHLRQTTALLARGIAIKSDILDAQAHVSDTQLALTRTDHARLRAIDELNRLLGRAQSSPLPELQPIGHLQLAGLNEDTPADALIEHHPQLVALEHQVDAARAGVSEASAGLRPNVGLVATQEWNNGTLAPKHPNTTIGAEVSLNLFAGGSDIAARHAAEARLAHLQYQLQDERQALKDNLADAWRQLHEAEQTAVARKDTLRQTAESLRIQTLRFGQGLEKSADVLDAHTRNDRSVANDINARFNLIVSRAAVLLAAGRLTPEVLNASQ